ncbi:hypothetical protein IMG5_122740 [Ichthyophthirius multifiliis]|uniref:Uncharacterized protein n=1 Tax=Ichthyophthirius multifiliis TaxID=5932 RepID=G0QVC3_ICHMU|nr:hypothetical protein IMG5_122740 [Ichthyophthirius multifiliis]EGR30841.1 hypothetical protein IMG5_122740 [Ichthyophthirius multifiliis]|eukprot:XP_004032428.1 hypothetical protein IMG5_122740 [Ichthyophthirius multifiliis]
MKLKKAKKITFWKKIEKKMILFIIYKGEYKNQKMIQYKFRLKIWTKNKKFIMKNMIGLLKKEIKIIHYQEKMKYLKIMLMIYRKKINLLGINYRKNYLIQDRIL